MSKTWIVSTMLALSLFASLAEAAETLSGDHLRIRALVPQSFGPNEGLVGILFEIDPHWHVYWKNPGDSGAPPKFNITATNATAGPIQWPIPKRLPIAHLTNFGYEDSVAYLFSLKPTDAKSLRVAIELEWLVCQEECIPGFGHLEFERPISELRWRNEDANTMREFATLLPAPADGAPFRIEKTERSGDRLLLRLTGILPSKLDLFPVNGGFVLPASPHVSEDGREFSFALVPAADTPTSLSFVATSEQGLWEFSNIRLSAVPASTENDTSLAMLLLSAVIGGFLLNLMPCVFPVISIKAFSLLKDGEGERVSSCLLYCLGVIATFAVLGAGFLALRGLGAAVGWGFQLQSPLVIFLLILLFWLMSLNFLGVFEIGTRVMNTAGRFSKTSSAFGTGVLSVFIAAPCTGPFMGTALGAAAVLPALEAFAIFVGLGVGLASPFFVFALSPRALAWLPRPGAWMETLKQFFAFPLFATVLWLLWVLGQQTETRGWLLASTALLAISFALWLGTRPTSPRSPTRARIRTVAAWILGLGAVALIGSRLQDATPATAKETSAAWPVYTPETLAAARGKGQAVFVDFTAAWCITCQVNKQTVLETSAGEEVFRKAGILTLRADWTRYDPVITKALAELGRNSVPVYVFYPSDGSAPRILPQILTLSMIENLKP